MNPQRTTPNVEAPSEHPSLENFDAYKAHILDRVGQTPIGRTPFHHLFIDGILPDDLYAAVSRKAFQYKQHAQLLPRLQDNKAFTNDRYSLVGNDDIETQYLRGLFSDDEIKYSLLKKFYLKPDQSLVQMLRIHEEFEYVYTARDRFQNLHVDVPAKFLSLVFYFPDQELGDEERRLNATILYDKELKPHYQAQYRANSVCVFAPHFHSYHGFATTRDRAALVMFYVDKELVEKHQRVVREAKPAMRLEAFKDTIQSKLETYPLLEYGASHNRIVSERKQCRINAPRGRVMRDEDQ
jgi:hypothetical protein